MNLNPTRRDEGMALLVSMIFLVVMGLTATWLSQRVINNARHVENYVDFENAFQGVESGLGQSSSELRNPTATGFVGVDENYDFTNGPPDFDSAAVTPVSLSSRPEVEFFAYAFNWATDGIDNTGDGQIDLGPETNGYYSVFASARVIRGGQVSAIRRAEQVLQTGNGTSIWDNAIFAGTGQAGGLINGNVAIHGSVHLLGDDIGDGGIALAAVDLSGTSLIHNNYDGLSDDLRGRVAIPPTVTFDGESGLETLEAVLRVKNGLVGMSGNSEVGSVHELGNDFKETMDGVYVTDGWTGNDMDASGDPQSVYSDNGWDYAYDLGSEVPFPTYDDDNGRDHEAWYLETGDPGEGLQHVHSGDVTIQSGSGSYYWNATTGVEIIGSDPGTGGMPVEADLNPDEYYVWYDDTTAEMNINGRIPVDGDVSLLAGNGNGNKLIDYEGSGSIMAFDDGSGGGDVEVDVSLKTTNFPDNLIGIMAEDDFTIGTSSQLEIMGGFYAQDEIIVDKQTTIMGTIVGNYFNMGKNVPQIYQVPALAEAWLLEVRMIGTNPIAISFAPISWRELAIL